MFVRKMFPVDQICRGNQQCFCLATSVLKGTTDKESRDNLERDRIRATGYDIPAVSRMLFVDHDNGCPDSFSGLVQLSCSHIQSQTLTPVVDRTTRHDTISRPAVFKLPDSKTQFKDAIQRPNTDSKSLAANVETQTRIQLFGATEKPNAISLLYP